VSVSDDQLQAAIAALNDGDRLREAEALVTRAAPELQHVLAEALASGGWLESHESELHKALALPDEAERVATLRVMLAEETRMGMMVGVAVGWALSQELSSREEK
jgi:hypothetical protein